MFHRLIATLLVLFCALPALGQFTRDKAGNKKIDEAINTHYFATDFDRAEGVLLGTIEACGDKCSPQTLARAWMYVGVVRGTGKKDIAGAKEAFSTALALDEKVKLDTDLASGDIKTAFEEVGGTETGGTVPPPAGGGDDIGDDEPVDADDIADIASDVPGGMSCTPEVREVQTRRPIPISCMSEAEPASAEVRYKPFGSETWEKVALTLRDKGMWQAEIPCSGTSTAGALRWYVQARAETGDVVDNYGTEEQPVVMSLTEDSAAEPPAFPGQSAPSRCTGMGTDEEICPPDFPGCNSGEQQCGEKDWGAACGNSTECKCGLLCVDGACETAPSCESDSDCPVGSCVGGTCGVSRDGEGGPAGPYKRIWIGAHFGFDIGTIGGDDVCYSATQANGTFACYHNGQPYPNADPNTAPRRAFFDPTTGRTFTEEPHVGTNIDSGFAPGTMRAMGSFDFGLTRNLTVGARAGFAFGGNPDDFMPIHAEGRFAYHIGGLSSGFDPYVGLSGGLAQVDMKVGAQMYNCSPIQKAENNLYGMPDLNGDGVYPPGTTAPDPTTGESIDYSNVPAGLDYQNCVVNGLGENKLQLPVVPVDVYQKSGNFFVGGNLGGIIRFGSEPKNMGVQLNVNVMVMLPKQAFVIEPSLGFVFGL